MGYFSRIGKQLQAQNAAPPLPPAPPPVTQPTGGGYKMSGPGWLPILPAAPTLPPAPVTNPNYPNKYAPQNRPEPLTVTPIPNAPTFDPVVTPPISYIPPGWPTTAPTPTTPVTAPAPAPAPAPIVPPSGGTSAPGYTPGAPGSVGSKTPGVDDNALRNASLLSALASLFPSQGGAAGSPFARDYAPTGGGELVPTSGGDNRSKLLLILAVIGIGGFLWYRHHKKKKAKAASNG